MIKIKKVLVPVGVEPPVIPGKRLTDEEFAAYVDFIQDFTGRKVKVTKEQLGNDTLAIVETEV